MRTRTLLVAALLVACRERVMAEENFPPPTSYILVPTSDAGSPLICVDPDAGWYYCDQHDAGQQSGEVDPTEGL
jgi:hypothetical protein